MFPDRKYKISEDDIDSFILEVHNTLVVNPLMLEDENEGFSQFHEFIHQRFEKYWSHLIKERNYN